jgi:hypothetical protein
MPTKKEIPKHPLEIEFLFGDEDECVELLIGADHRWLCWSLGNGVYLCVHIYRDGSHSYHISNRTALQNDIVNNYLPQEISVSADTRKRLADLGLRRILNFVNKVK